MEKSLMDYVMEICKEIAEMLVEKNKSYGNSVGDPVKIFSDGDVIDRLNVRIDDKLSRIGKGTSFRNEDTELDLIGYLILKRALIRKRTDDGLG